VTSTDLLDGFKRWLRSARARVLLGVIVITLVGAYFRIAHLSDCSMRADTIEYWKLCSSGLTPSQIIFDKARGAQAHQMYGWTVAQVRLFLDVFHLPLTFLTVRLPFVLWGVLAIPLAYLTGRRLGGWTTGLTTAALLALSPFHIQSSREAYPYVITVTAAFIAVWAIFRMGDYLLGRARLSIPFYLASIAGIYLLMRANASSQPFALVAMAALGCMALYRAIKRPRAFTPLLALGGLATVAVLPKVFRVLRATADGTVGKSQAALHGSQLLLDPRGLKFFSNTAWGDTPLRIGFTIGVLLLALVVVWKRRKDCVYPWAALLLLVAFPLWMVSRYIASAPAYPRYMAALQPVYLLMLSMGLTQGLVLLLPGALRKGLPATVASCLLPAIGIALLLHPALLASRLPGTPVPYKQISEWCDSNLPAGTPVLPDYWLSSWNQFRVHPSANAVYMYTVPNEPVDVFIGNRWRDTAVNFLTANPDAAYLELSKRFWADSRVGPWDWPHKHFAQRKTFINEPFLALANMGLSYRQPDRKRMREKLNGSVVIELFYNRPQDVANRAKQGGQPATVVYRSGWEYTKTRDMRDWRVLDQQATLHVYNLTDDSQDIVLSIKGVALGGMKTIIIGDGIPRQCKPNVLLDVRETLRSLPPGVTVVTVRDIAGGKSSSKMLVGAVSAALPAKDG